MNEGNVKINVGRLVIACFVLGAFLYAATATMFEIAGYVGLDEPSFQWGVLVTNTFWFAVGMNKERLEQLRQRFLRATGIKTVTKE